MKLFHQTMLVAVTAGLLFSSNPVFAKSDAQTWQSAPVVAKSVYQADPSIKFTLEQIMADPDWLGRSPESAFWSADSSQVFYQQKRAGSDLRDWFQRPLSAVDNGVAVPLSQLHQMGSSNVQYSADRQLQAWVFEGNIFVRKADGGILQVTRSNQSHSAPQFLNDNRLLYRQGWTFYTVDLTSGISSELISLKTEEQPKAPAVPTGYLAQEQHKLIDYVAKVHRHKVEQHQAKVALRDANPAMAPEAVYLGKDQQIVDASISPNADYLLVAVRKAKPRNEKDIMPNYITESGDIAAQPVRWRVTDFKPEPQKLILVSLTDGSQYPLSYTSLPGYNEDVLAEVKAENAKAKGEKYKSGKVIRDIGLMTDWYWSQSAMRWHNSGDQVAVMLKAFDNKDRWIATIDFDKKALVPQHRLHDTAWVNYAFNDFGWFNNSKTLYFLSEESGYSHIYTKELTDRKAKKLTSGTFEVSHPTLTTDDNYLYFKANVSHPGIYEVYRLDLANAKKEQLTRLGGMTDFTLAPDEQKLLLTHSTSLMPEDLYLMAAKPDAEVIRLTDTVSAEFKRLPLVAPQVVAVPSSHTKQPIFSKVYYPADYQQGEPRRAVIFNHGAGYLQNSDLGWSGYFREFLFHNLLAQQGYVVMDMDYRASKGYGRDWRTAIYRQMGTPEVEDLADGVNWLVNNANVDRQRIGTYGGSYGGFMTFMALFKQPDLFQAGAALRPVSDWAYYNHPYTSNILNTPDIDPIAYERSSPIYFTQGLTKPLLINAPMVDDNVFFQDVVRLVQRLIEQEKQDFETAIYPVEPHGFRQPSSWLDEYRRIYKLFEQNL
ncbi:S9 family peptidase [Arsukibacterium indicum]|uniref:Prolyl oligopeptidase family serine peptidase n=1 Tax=Arsukibacterium indicum TaxID=2848612 RepID=A0ABS6MFY5_9GAMM|nr:prolyl oligopeptidase family serine peptidase [Arsukibacterium indicum]MBV2127645.1 prolyl oligopeptidase family serine peptidase [Arsukibacterium indicum]